MRPDKSGRGNGPEELVGDGHQVSGMGESQVEFALEILLGDFEILQGHVGTLVAKEFDNRGKADAGAQHLSSVCVSKLVRDDASGNAESGGDVSQGGTEFANHLVAAALSRQQQSAGLGRGGWP